MFLVSVWCLFGRTCGTKSRVSSDFFSSGNLIFFGFSSYLATCHWTGIDINDES